MKEYEAILAPLQLEEKALRRDIADKMGEMGVPQVRDQGMMISYITRNTIAVSDPEALIMWLQDVDPDNVMAYIKIDANAVFKKYGKDAPHLVVAKSSHVAVREDKSVEEEW